MPLSREKGRDTFNAENEFRLQIWKDKHSSITQIITAHFQEKLKQIKTKGGGGGRAYNLGQRKKPETFEASFLVSLTADCVKVSSPAALVHM